VAQALYPVDGGEGELGHHPAVEDGIEHGEEGGEGEAYGEHRLHLDHRQILISVLQFLLILMENKISLSGTYEAFLLNFVEYKQGVCLRLVPALVQAWHFLGCFIAQNGR